ncbi:MAG: DUF5615 family PIN-like protein [Bacillota bacterium]
MYWECFYVGRLSQWLADQGHEVREVRKRNQTMSDEEVINWAVEEKRIIITVDMVNCPLPKANRIAASSGCQTFHS